jgi:hypothetical protein
VSKPPEDRTTLWLTYPYSTRLRPTRSAQRSRHKGRAVAGQTGYLSMPKKLTIQQLDHIRRTDPGRGLDIIEKRAQRDLANPDPLVRFKGQVTEDAVKAARERMQSQKGR